MAKTQDTTPPADPEQPPDFQEVATDQEEVEPDEVDLPTIGRIVHLRINLGYEEVAKLRPAIVLDCHEDGQALLKPFLSEDDFPLPNQAARARADGWFDYGHDCAEWRWPER